MDIKYIVWGAGVRGGRVLKHIGSDKVEAFIDSNTDKIGKEFLGKKIISFDEYRNKYNKDYIVIACMCESEVTDLLNEYGIYKYFLMSECPGELQEPIFRTILREYIQNFLKKEYNYAIYGVTLYSLILNDWIEQYTGKRVTLIVHQSLNNKLYHALRKDLINETFIEMDKACEYNIDSILVAYENELNMVKTKMELQYNIHNIYDCSDDISRYHNDKIEAFKNIHTEKRCFIIATGPSLRMDDLERLRLNNEICISMNSIWKAFDQVKWRPDYYVAEDFRVYSEYGDVLDDIEVGHLFLADVDQDYWAVPHSENKLKYHIVYEFSEEKLPKFSEDFAQKSYAGATVTFSCIQLAAYMGFKEIYLVGVDFTNGKDSVYEKYGHFYPEKKLKSVGYNKMVYLAYMSAKRYADNHGIKIYNATRGGKLDVFDRVEFDKLF